MSQALFKTKQVKIDTLGEYLALVRNKLNMDIKTVSLLTQIKPIYLENLEAGNYKQLPAEVYVRGFLKSLSNLYHIEEQVLIEQYEKEHGFEPKETVTATKRSSRVNINPRTAIILLTTVLVLLLSGYVGAQVKSILAPPFLEVTDPPSDGLVQGNTLVISGRAEIGADITINKQAVVSDRNGQFNENIILSPGVNVIEVAVVNKFDRESKVIRTINAEIPQSQPEAVNEPVNITIEIGPESTWIYMEADGVVEQRGTMLAGSTKTISAKEQIILTSANAGSTRVIYNGKDLGQLGRDGEVIRNVEFSNQNN